MNLQDNNNFPDDLFRQELNSFEDVYDPKAWEDMRIKLEADERRPWFLFPFIKIKSNNNLKTIIIIMSILSLISSVALLFSGTTAIASQALYSATSEVRIAIVDDKPGSTANYTNSSVDNNTVVNGTSTNSSIAEISSASANNSSVSSVINTNSNSSIIDNATNHTETAAPLEVMQNNTGTIDQTVVPAATKVVDPIKTVAGKIVEASKDSSLLKPVSQKVTKAVIYKSWVGDRYEYVEVEKKGSIKDGWIGLHFTEQYSHMKTPWDSSGMLKRSQGFNVQFMSGNRLSTENFAGYFGFDFGMQFYGRTPKTNVVLNNTSQDSGFTRLYSHSLDFMVRGHFEYNKHRLVPYVNVFGGPRFYSTGQRVTSYVPLQDNENSMTNNVSLTATLMAGVGIGARLQITPAFSLDARYEWTAGTKTKIVNTSGSTFNGLNYNLDKREINSNFGQLKVGVIFNISETEYTKKLVEPAHYVERVDSIVVDVSDTGKIMLPCNCKPCDKTNNTSEVHPNNTEERIPETINTGSNGTTRTSSGSGGGGSGKGSFPGIKPPAPRPSEKR
ncbi:MAG: hypothetical protein V4613_05355 [Bacteroidota bacterium]